MVTIHISYEGDLRCKLIHGPSGATLHTDAPKDNHGKGESFSPTDLEAAALGSCMLTVMGIYAQRHGINLNGTQVTVNKEMVQDPIRRIGKLASTIKFSKGIPQNHREPLKKCALTCPVQKSIHPDIEAPVTFEYPD